MDRFDWLEFNDSGDAPAAVSASADHRFAPDADTLYRRARQLREGGHFRSAVMYYEQVIGVEAQHFRAWREWIDTLVRARQLPHAEAISTKALGLYPHVPELYAARGLVLLHTGHLDEAKAHLERGHAAGDHSWYLACVQAEIILSDNKGYSDEVLACLDRAVAQAEHPWEAHFIAGWFLLDAELPTWAAGYLAEAGHHNPTAPIVWLCLGDCFKELRLYDQALFYYQKATELEPKHQLALKRQRACHPHLFGLLHIFKKKSLLERWNAAIKNEH